MSLQRNTGTAINWAKYLSILAGMFSHFTPYAGYLSRLPIGVRSGGPLAIAPAEIDNKTRENTRVSVHAVPTPPDIVSSWLTAPRIVATCESLHSTTAPSLSGRNYGGTHANVSFIVSQRVLLSSSSAFPHYIRDWRGNRALCFLVNFCQNMPPNRPYNVHFRKQLIV